MLLLFLAALVLIAFLPQTSGKTIPYPFLLVTPHWHTAFRKYKLLWTIPFLAAFLVIGYVYENENLALFSLGCTAFVGTLPYFERGHTAHIAASKYIGNHFLFREIKTAFLNFLMIFTPVFVLFLVFFEISYFWTLPLFFTLPLLGLLTQYSFYGSPLTQSVVLALLLAFSPYGLPIVVLPVFYFSSLRFIKKIQYADN